MPAILLGVWGFYIDLTSSGRTDTDSIWFWLSILYSTLQLFVMECNVVNQAAPLSWQREREFLIRYPQAASAGQVRFLPQSLEDTEARQQLFDWASDPESHLAIATCRDDDILSLALALSLLAKVLEQTTTVYSWQNQPQVLDQVLSVSRGSGARIVPLGAEEPMASAATILEDRLDRLAKAIHNDYVQARIADGSHNPADLSHQEWSYLGQGFRNSNRAQADHMDVKLRAVHCRRVPGAEPEKKVTVFTPDEVEMLAEMEHARWCAERFLAGWTYGTPKDKARKISPDLVPWGILPEPIREYDRQAVRRLPEHVGLLGEEIEREKFHPPSSRSTVVIHVLLTPISCPPTRRNRLPFLMLTLIPLIHFGGKFVVCDTQ